VQANVWIWLFGFVGNYFWTHYFYKVLGASYSFPVTIMLNDVRPTPGAPFSLLCGASDLKQTLRQVPFFLYLITHAYFCSYHTVSTILLRRFWTRYLHRVCGGVFHVVRSDDTIF
jgi:cycloeucalenol cycloisomerase